MSGKIEISRELLGVYLGVIEGDWVEAGHELRALLAATVVERQPVAWRWEWKEAREHDGWCYVDKYPDQKVAHLMDIEPLYAEQPAPVAVVPDGWRLVPLHPTMDMLDALMDWNKVGNVNAYNNILNAAPACLDKVKELNQ